MIWAAVTPALARYGPALALVAGAGLAGWWAYGVVWQRGYDAHAAEIAAETAKRQAALDDLAADLRARALELERAEQDRADLERRLADEASDDPMADDPGLGLDSLRRLNRIR